MRLAPGVFFRLPSRRAIGAAACAVRRAGPLRLIRGALIGLVIAAAVRAQEAGDLDLGRATEAYLAEISDAEAATALARLLAANPGASAVLEVVSRRRSGEAPTELLIAHADEALRVVVSTPPGHGPSSSPLPVCLNLKLGRIPDVITVAGAINVSAPAYDLRRFREADRDGVLEILRTVAWAANGDPDRLWMSGFSWAAHATFDVALHRPGALAGIIALAGAPRRDQFRLLPNLADTRIWAACGAKDDAELIWNLRELDRLRQRHGYDLTLVLDDTVPGRLYPSPRGVAGVAAAVQEPTAREGRTRGTMLADSADVASGWLRVEAVDDARTRVPERVPVRGATLDARRRATVTAMNGAVVEIGWRWSSAGDVRSLGLTGSGVERATVLLDTTLVPIGTRYRIGTARDRGEAAVLVPDARTILEEARRTGSRLRPVVRSVSVGF